MNEYTILINQNDTPLSYIIIEKLVVFQCPPFAPTT